MDAARVVFVGSVNVDRMMLLDRLPSPGESITGGHYRESFGGKGANQAVAAARIGGRVALIAAVGSDAAGRSVLDDLAAERIDLRYLRITTLSTAVALGIIDRRTGQNVWAIDSGANLEVDVGTTCGALERLVTPGDVVVSVHEVPQPTVGAAAVESADLGARFVLNAAPGRPLDADLVRRCSVIVANEIEIDQLGFPGPHALLRAGADAVIVTNGEAGANLFRRDLPVYHVDALPVEAVDATGAGDAFVGALAVALAEKRSLETAVDWAVTAGSLACRAAGARASMPDREELLAAIRQVT